MSKKVDETHYLNVFSNNVNFKERIIYFNSGVDEMSLSLFQKALDELEKDSRPITIEVSTYGGDVDEMFGIIDRLRSSPCVIRTRGFGKIMSAGTLILAAGTPGYRLIGPSTQFMIHELSDELEGTVTQLRKQLRDTIKYQELMYRRYYEFSGEITPVSKWRKLMRGTDKYLSPEEVLELGLVDYIIKYTN